MTSIKIEGLTKIYPKLFGNNTKAIDNITLSVEQGEIFGFLGPNGAGKTTLLKMLAGLLYPTSGQIWILGQTMHSVLTKQSMGFLSENPSFYNHLTGFELLGFASGLFGAAGEKRTKSIDTLLQNVGLAESRNIRISDYSKGMIQRLGIAQALVNNPELLILDEPLSGLDPIGRKEFKEIMLSLKEEGKTVFFSTHILADVERICDRVGILHKGSLLRTGELNSLLSERQRNISVSFKPPEDRKTPSFPDAKLTAEGYWNITVKGEKQEEVVASLLKDKAHIISIIPETVSLEDFFVSEIAKNET